MRPRSVLSVATYIRWMVMFFFASAGASSRLLDRQRDLSLETRALAIAMFYAIGTAIGGIAVPLLFGILIAKHSTWLIAGGYVVAAALMCDPLTTFGTIIG